MQNFTLTLAPTSAEPGLWGHLAAGKHLNSATIHVRKASGDLETEYVTYTLTNVFITSFSISEGGGDVPTDTIHLTFGRVTESYRPINPDGSLGAANTAQYDQVTATSDGAGSLATTALGTPAVGLAFVDAGVTEAELPVLSYAWARPSRPPRVAPARVPARPYPACRSSP